MVSGDHTGVAKIWKEEEMTGVASVTFRLSAWEWALAFK